MIPVTHLWSDGRKQIYELVLIWTIEDKARKMIREGWTFEAEVLRYDRVKLTCLKHGAAIEHREGPYYKIETFLNDFVIVYS